MKPTKGLIFSVESIVAMLAGIKTQTRRLSGLQTVNAEAENWKICEKEESPDSWNKAALSLFLFEPIDPTKTSRKVILLKCPWKVGDQIYAKETWRRSAKGLPDGIEYRADGLLRFFDSSDFSAEHLASKLPRDDKWRSPFFMPRWAARPELFRTITGIRCERVQEISFRDIVGEGYNDPGQDHRMQPGEFPCGITWFRNRWNSLHAKLRPVRANSKWANALGWCEWGKAQSKFFVKASIPIMGYISFPFAAEDGDLRETIQGKPHKRCVNCWTWVLEFGESE